MLKEEDKGEEENDDIRLLEEWLPKIQKESRNYIKGAAEALLFAQEEDKNISKCKEK